MKRAAAILGPTPPFIRWAIDAPCPFLRGTDTHPARNPAQSRWRQLRSLKEVAQARAEGRVHAGYCFAPTASATNVIGVQLEEVTAPLGGTEHVAESCRRCLANPSPLSGTWAPCTGILPWISSRETLEETKQAWAEQRSWLDQSLADGLGRSSLANDSPRPTRWLLVWQGPSMAGDRLQAARAALETSGERFVHARQAEAELRAALEHASRHSLRLWIESVPIGWSDGQTWQLPAHCQNCGAEWRGPGGGACASCDSAGSYQAERRLKVLGLRPFVQLSSVLGAEPARQLFGDYQAARVKQSPADQARGVGSEG